MRQILQRVTSMDTNGKGSKSGEVSLSENSRTSTSEVALVIDSPPTPKPAAMSIGTSSSSSKPPKIPPTSGSTPGTPRKLLTRSVYSKSKSRFGEQSPVFDSGMFDQEPVDHIVASSSPLGNISTRASPNYNGTSDTHTPKGTVRTNSVTLRSPLMSSPGGVRGVDEGEESYKKVSKRNKLKNRKVRVKVSMEWIVFVCIMGFLTASLTIEKLEKKMIWGLEIWKWCVLVLVTFSGMLLTNWFMHFVVLLIELNFLFKKKVLYFVHGLKQSVQVCIWLVLVLVTWMCLFNNHGVERSSRATRILDYVTWTIVSLLIGACLWVLKTTLLKILASTFHVTTFFDRIQESILHQYVLRILSGSPLHDGSSFTSTTTSNEFTLWTTKKGKEGKVKKEKIDISKLSEMKPDNVSAWKMKILVDVIASSGLYTLSNELDESVNGGRSTGIEITTEEEAWGAAHHIFKNVAQSDYRYICEMDLRRFMSQEVVDHVLEVIEVSEEGRIDKKALTEWVVKVFKDRKALAHALNDTKTAVKQLNKIVIAVLIIVVLVIWLLLVEIATTKVLVLLSSQLVLAAFMFGNTLKTIFEAIIFVFVMHPFDVGDRCVIDGVQMIVEEMNILTTVFLRYDNEMIFYPNSVLATKPISNFFRSPNNMGDSLDFSIDFMTPVEKIGSLKNKVKKYLEDNSHFWHSNHNMVVKDIENVSKLKMALIFSHKFNFQDYGDKMRRKTELVLQMKKFFEELDIKYNLLPQQVHLLNSESTTVGSIR